MSPDTPTPLDAATSRTDDPVVRRLAFLASAGEVLSSSLDYAQTLQDVARLAVPMLGDLCIVDVLEGGLVHRVAMSARGPGEGTAARGDQAQLPADA